MCRIRRPMPCGGSTDEAASPIRLLILSRRFMIGKGITICTIGARHIDSLRLLCLLWFLPLYTLLAEVVYANQSYLCYASNLDCNHNLGSSSAAASAVARRRNYTMFGLRWRRHSMRSRTADYCSTGRTAIRQQDRTDAVEAGCDRLRRAHR